LNSGDTAKPQTDTRRLINRLLSYMSGRRKVIGFALLSMVVFALCKNFPILVIERLLDTVFAPGQDLESAKSDLTLYAGLILVSAFIGGISYWFNEYLFKWMSYHILVSMRMDLMDHVLRLPLRFFNKQRMGSLVSRVTNDVQISYRTINIFMSEIILLPIMAVTALAVSFAISWQLSLCILPLIPLMILPVLRLGKRVKKRSRRGLESLEDTTEIMLQTISGIRTVKSCHAEDFQLDRFRASNASYLERAMKVVKTKSKGRGQMDFLYTAAVAGFILGGGHLVLNKTWGLTAADFVAFLMAVTAFYRPLKRLASAFNNFQESLAATNRIFELLDAPISEEQVIDGKPISGIDGDLVIENVSFAYDRNGVQALNGVSFKIGKGETVALVGPSGAGKSTIADLLAGFYRPDDGQILVNGQDLWSLDRQSYLERVALVSQSPFVFNTTIRENILYGDKNATEEEIRHAATLANLQDVIAELPEGYETVVGERGAALSGGQLQRLTIARALLKKPDLLILDEATSALDVGNEKLVQDAIDNLAAERTTLVIAHRLSTVRSADRILVLEDGRIVEMGNHDELLARGGAYAELHALQLN
jgi:subfamily B ATP-binding cassette protein MsbA